MMSGSSFCPAEVRKARQAGSQSKVEVTSLPPLFLPFRTASKKTVTSLSERIREREQIYG